MWPLTAKKWRNFLSLIFLSSLLLIPPVTAQSTESWAEVGRLPIQHINQSVFEANSTNWDVVQDERGILYVANASGLLIHDGVSWEIVEVPAGTVRSVELASDGKVYVAGSGHLGYVQVDAVGTPSVTSLLQHLPEAYRGFRAIYRIFAHQDGVYFSARKYLFRWQDNKMTVWETDGVFRDLFTFNDQLFINGFDKIYHLTASDSLSTVAVDSTFAPSIWQILEDGPGHIIGYSPPGLFRCQMSLSSISNCHSIKTDIDDQIHAWRPYIFHRLTDRSIAIGFDGNGLAILAPDGSLKRHIGEKDGLENLEVMNLFTDKEGALWLALYDGLARIEANGRWSDFSRSEGVPSKVQDIIRWNGTLYVATMLGLYQLVPGDYEHAPRFEVLLNSHEFLNCYDLEVVNAKLLAGCFNGLVQIDAKQGPIASTELIFPGHYFEILRDPITSSTLFLAGQNGFSRLQIQGNKVEQIYHYPFTPQIFDVVVEPRNPGQTFSRLWAIAGTKNLYRLDVPDNGGDWKLLRIDDSHNLSSAPNSLALFNDTLRIATDQGLFSLVSDAPRFRLDRFSSERSVAFIEKDYPLIFAEDSLKSLNIEDRTLVTHSFSSRLDALNEINALYADADSQLWIGHRKGLSHMELESRDDYRSNPSLLITELKSLVSDSTLYNGLDTKLKTLRIPYHEASIRFAFAAQVYDFPGHVQYRTRLDGLDREWGKWTSETVKEYTQLREGRYSFHVQAQNMSGDKSEVILLSIEVLPPWYRTAWAYGLWVFTGVLFFFGAVKIANRYQTRRLEARNVLLNNLIEQQTQEIQSKNTSLTIAYEEAQVINDNLIETNRILESSMDQLRDALEANKEILGITAHDLKNPLGGIIGLAEMIIEDFELGTQATFDTAVDNIPMLKDEAERMLQIVKNLLDKHREEEETKLVKEKTFIADIVSAVLRWNQKQAKIKGIQLHYNPEESIRVNIDSLAIQRVLDNYVSNAIKYSPLNSNVWINIQMQHEWVKVLVKDEGPGLNTDDLLKVFGKMQRLSATPTGGEHSTGLGLFIVKKLIEAHGGTVGVDSVYGEGSVFWFTLPFAETNQQTHPERDKVPAV